jgi:predicted ATPase/class 3 adenylate cyclase
MSQQELPSGIVTFLYTDIEGSTPLWERLPEAMRASEELHHHILRQAINAHGGLVYKVIGDAFQAAFVKPVQALEAAIAAQRGLANTDWGETGRLQVRMGIHTGQAQAQGDDYSTTHTLNRVARVMSAAHGGQILISQAVAELALRALPVGVSLRDMGQHRLKGLSQPEHLYQLVVPDLPQDFPPLATLAERSSNLPIQLFPFVGRQAEIAVARELMTEAHLLTISGPGGVGKTRLAIQIAEELLDQFSSGVWFVDLASLSDPALVPQAVAAAIGLQEQAGGQVSDMLLSYLESKSVLLILDNCEHLVDACAQLAHKILLAAPNCKLLVTSRQLLGLTAEQVYPLDGLDIPEIENEDEVKHSPAVQLFAQCARRVAVDFELREHELEAVIRICRLVQGMPLGILLAAAWVDLLSLDEIAAEISNSVDFLESQMRDVPERHRSVRAAFEYSWNLLSEVERTALANMSVFQAGFDRRAAQVVSGVSLRSLNTLAHKSLLQREAGTGRYYLHGLIRQFAWEQLDISGNCKKILFAHSNYYLAYISEKESELKGERQLQALDEVEADFENIRAAWTWAVEQDDATGIGNALEGMFLYTTFRSHFSQGYELFRQARRQWPASRESQSALAGRLLIRFPDPEADPEEVYQLGMDIAQRNGDRAEIAYALNQLGSYLAHSGRDHPRGIALLEEGLSRYRELGDDFGAARVLDDIAFAYSLTDQVKRLSYGRQSLKLRRRIGDQIGAAKVLRNLAIAAIWLGRRVREGRGYIDEALEIARWMRDLNSIGWMVSLQAEDSLLRGHFAESQVQVEEAYRVGQEINARDIVNHCLIVRSLQYAIIDGDYARARQIFLEIHPPVTEENMLWWGFTAQALVACGLGEFIEARVAIQRALGQMLKGGISLATWPQFVPVIAIILLQGGQTVFAAECLGYFDNLDDDVVAWGQQWALLSRLRLDLEISLGQEAYELALDRGKRLSIQAVAAQFELP